MQGNPIVLVQNNQYPYSTHELHIFSATDHCPMVNVNIGYNFNLESIRFDVMNNDIVQPITYLGYPLATPPTAGTQLEQDLLQYFGKVMYYKVEFGSDPYTFTEEYFVLALEAEVSLDPAEWDNIGITDSFGLQLYAHNGPGGSRELVVDAESVSSAGFQRSGRSFLTTNYGWRTIETMYYNNTFGLAPWFPDHSIKIHIY